MPYTDDEFERELTNILAKYEQRCGDHCECHHEVNNTDCYTDITNYHNLQHLVCDNNIRSLRQWLHESSGCDIAQTSRNAINIDDNKRESFHQSDNGNEDSNTII